MPFEPVRYIVPGYAEIFKPCKISEKSDCLSAEDRFIRAKGSTETYEALKVYMDMNFDGLKDSILEMMGNGRCRINYRKFQNDMTTFKSRDDVLTLLVHLGYLAYDEAAKEVFIPNMEIYDEFENAVEGTFMTAREITDIYASENGITYLFGELRDVRSDTGPLPAFSAWKNRQPGSPAPFFPAFPPPQNC